MNRYLLFIVKKESDKEKKIDYYVLPDFKTHSDFLDYIKNCGFSQKGYTTFFNGVKKACNKLDVCASHPYTTAVQYLHVLLQLIKWAGTGADGHLSQEDLKQLMKETKERVGNILKLVTVPDSDGKHFAIRNFTTCTTYFKGPFVERLNQLLTKY